MHACSFILRFLTYCDVPSTKLAKLERRFSSYSSYCLPPIIRYIYLARLEANSYKYINWFLGQYSGKSTFGYTIKSAFEEIVVVLIFAWHFLVYYQHSHCLHAYCTDHGFQQYIHLAFHSPTCLLMSLLALRKDDQNIR